MFTEALGKDFRGKSAQNEFVPRIIERLKSIMKNGDKVTSATRSVVTDTIRNVMVQKDAMTGAEAFNAAKGLRECYGAIEKQLNISPNQLPESIKNVVRFEFDQVVGEYTKTTKDWQLQRVNERYGCNSGMPFKRRSASWRNDNVPVTAYPQVCNQLTKDNEKLAVAYEEQVAVNNIDAARKIQGRIRQNKNNMAMLGAAYNEFVAEQAARKATSDVETALAALDGVSTAAR